MDAMWQVFQALDVRRRRGKPPVGTARKLVHLAGAYVPMLQLSGTPLDSELYSE